MSISELQRLVVSFNERRGWRAKHSPLHLAMSISIEAAELLECLQWKVDDDLRARIRSDAELRSAVAGELADVAIYLLGMSDACAIDLDDAVRAKLRINEVRFPIRDGAT
jgi:dCTP diphosphatase